MQTSTVIHWLPSLKVKVDKGEKEVLSSCQKRTFDREVFFLAPQTSLFCVSFSLASQFVFLLFFFQGGALNPVIFAAPGSLTQTQQTKTMTS